MKAHLLFSIAILFLSLHGSRVAPSRRRMYAGSVGLQLMLINFKSIAAGGMVPPERLPTASKGGGLRKHKMPAVHWWSHSTRL